MNNINNLQELRAEKKRLQTVAQQQKSQLKQDAADIQESLQPVNLLLNAVHHFTGIKFEKETFLKNGLAYGISIIAQQTFLKAEQKAEEKLHEWAVALVEKVKNYIQSHWQKEKPNDATSASNANPNR